MSTSKRLRGESKKTSQSTRADKTPVARHSSPPRGPPVPRTNTFPIVGVGASAGGLEAFTQLLTHLPNDTGLAFVLVQHLDPQHESALTQILARATKMPVREAKNNLAVEANSVYVIPPNTKLRIEQRMLKLEPRQSSRTPARSIDHFFESLAHDLSERAIGVILSGTASDGTLGLEAIKAEGGITLAQDESAKYDSMPRSAIAAGCVDFILSPEHIARELVRIAKHPSIAVPSAASSPENDRASATDRMNDRTALPSGGHGIPDDGAERAHSETQAKTSSAMQDGFKSIVLLLRAHSGVDFSLYKSTTIERRIVRRMVLSRHNEPADYAKFLKGNTRELDALYSDVLISVTSFFRNPEAFDVLKTKVFPKLLKQRRDQPFRVWVLGCSTGQEAYSIAMSFIEAADGVPGGQKLQVFATDLNEGLLEKARQGLYAKSLVQDISPERLRHFFVEEQGGYRVIKSLRECVVFARQNVISDPPFSRMDLISCRNLLIYLEPSLQKKAFPTFHYALKPNGVLFLGSSESISGHTELFEPLDKKHKLFSRKAAPNPAFYLSANAESRVARKDAPPVVSARGRSRGNRGGSSQPWETGSHVEVTAQREADRMMVNQFAPPGVLINDDLQILQFRGATSAYLEPPAGKASFDVLKMAREGLMLPLRAAIVKARKENKTVRTENVRLRQNNDVSRVNLIVIPLRNVRERSFLILFEAPRSHDARDGAVTAPRRTLKGDAKRSRHAQSAGQAAEGLRERIAELQIELAETRDYLQSVHEQHEAANEELQASNEEVQSANEELQSVNEELETSKEELESSNEELITINEEMAHRNAELSRLNSDLGNLQTSTKLAIVLLGRDLTIRRFSTQAEKQFHLLATDLGRPIGNIRHDLVLPKHAEGARSANASDLFAPTDLESVIAYVIETVHETEQEVQDKEGRWYSLRVRPYMTLDNKVDGAVLVLVDIDALKRSERATKAARDYAEAMLRTTRDPLVVLRGDLRVNTANEAFYKAFQLKPEQTEGRTIFELSEGAWRSPELRMLLEDIVPRNSFFDDFEITRKFPPLGVRTMQLNARRLDFDDRGTPSMVLLAIEDVTDQRLASQATVELAAIVQTTDDAIFTKTVDHIITSWNRGAERLFGYRPEEILGMSDELLRSGSRHGEWQDIYKRLRRNETVTDVETVWLTKTNSAVYVSLGVAPLVDGRGELIGASVIARDISGRKRGEQNLSLLASVGAQLVKLTNVEDIARVIGAEIGEHFGISICTLMEIDAAAEHSITHVWRADGTAGVPGNYRITDFLSPALVSAGQAGQTFVVRDTATDPRVHGAKFTALNIGAFLSVQLISEERWRYALSIGRAQPYDWRDDEIALLRELAGLVGARLDRVRSEDALRISEERYYTLFESIDEGFCVIEKITGDGQLVDFRYVEANPAFEMQSGLADVVGKTVREVAPGESEEWYATYDSILTTGKPLRFERELTTRGRMLDLYAFRIEDGTNSRVAVIFNDITARKHAEEAVRESEQRYRTIFDLGPIAIYSCDAAGIIRQFNRHAVELWGREPRIGETDELFCGSFRMHRTDGTFMPREFCPMADVLSGKVGETRDSEVIIERPDGSRITVVVNIRPLTNSQGEIIGALNCFYDITERSRLEQMAKDQAAALVDLDRRKDEFLAMLSHELRNPLAPIANVVSLLHLHTSTDPVQQRAGRIMERQVAQLKRLIDDLMEVSRITTGRVQLRKERIAIGDIVERAVDTVEQSIEQHRHTLSLTVPSTPIWIEGDATRLEQVVVNLLGNAAKYTDDGGQIWLTVERENEHCVLRVRDTGIGIPPELLPRIFDLFTQAERSLDRSRGGLGIGLALVRRLVEMHHGSVEVQSTVDEGSEFLVRLPLAIESAQFASHASEPASTASRSLRVLIVDDNEDEVESLSQLVKAVGHEVETARDGLAALNAASSFRPNVMFLDIGLPELNGYEVAKRIREQRASDDLVLVAISGYAHTSDRERSAEAGFNHHLAKPADFSELQSILATVAERKANGTQH